ncbi:MAG: hypothetical protein ACRD3Q_17780, partial [Terriglobales bacterium]
ELTQMKRQRPGATDQEENERVWRAEHIDGTYALTSYWQQYKAITHRREVLVGGEPGSGIDTRSLRDGTEREIHEELAERLSRNPGKSDGVAILSEAEDWLVEIMSTKDMDSELQLTMLFRYAANWETLNLARGIVARLIVEQEQSGGEAPSDIGWILFEYLGPSFTEREFSALLTALEQSTNTLHPFLEYLESHMTGRQVIDRWIDWISATDWDTIFQPFTFARVSLSDGFGADVLQEIEETGTLDQGRARSDFSYLASIGAIIGKGANDGLWNLQPPKLRYWPRTQREHEKNAPKGWAPIKS